jgi:hypothetical protein
VTKLGCRLVDVKGEMLQNALGILCSLYKIVDHQCDTIGTLQFHPYGLHLDSCLQIIESAKAAGTCDVTKLIVVLCLFPIEANCSSEGASVFALEALQVILSDISSKGTAALSSHQFISLLDRLSVLSPFVTEDQRCCLIIEKLIGCRRILVTN